MTHERIRPTRTLGAVDGSTLGEVYPPEPRSANETGAAATGVAMAREAILARTLVELADTLVADFDVVEVLTLLTDRCVEILDVDAAGLMLLAPEGDLRVMASSSEAMRVLELFELQSEEGPCLDCFNTGFQVSAGNLAAAADRWPRFACAAIEGGFHAVNALPMRLRGTVIGALNMFQNTTGEISQADSDAAQALADIATITILQHRASVEARGLNIQLNLALNSRVLIEQAKGVVAERNRTDMEQAFSELRTYARYNNLRLVDVARDVIEGKVSVADLVPSRPTAAPKRADEPARETAERRSQS